MMDGELCTVGESSRKEEDPDNCTAEIRDCEDLQGRSEKPWTRSVETVVEIGKCLLCY